MGNEDDNPTKTCWIKFSSPICLLVSLNAEVYLLVVVVIVGCVQGSWSQVSTFSCYSLPPSDTRVPVRGMKTIFKSLCYITDYVCFAKTVSPAPVFVRIPGSHHPGTRLRLVPGFRDPGSVLILGQVTQYGNPYLICIAILKWKNSDWLNKALYAGNVPTDRSFWWLWCIRL